MLQTPPFDLDRIRVGDCMHHGIVSCDAAAPLSEVAATMCTHRVHALAVLGDGRPAAIVSDADLMAAIDRDGEYTAGDIAATEWLAISSGRSLQDAARLMTEHGVTHLLVRDAAQRPFDRHHLDHRHHVRARCRRVSRRAGVSVRALRCC